MREGEDEGIVLVPLQAYTYERSGALPAGVAGGGEGKELGRPLRRIPGTIAAGRSQFVYCVYTYIHT